MKLKVLFLILTKYYFTSASISTEEILKYSISPDIAYEIQKSESLKNLNNAFSFLESGNEFTSFGTDKNKQFLRDVSNTWELAFEAEAAYNSEDSVFAAMELGVTSPFFPFLVCIQSYDESGYERMQTLSKRFEDINNHLVTSSIDAWSDFGSKGKSTAFTNSDVVPVYNSIERSCFAFNSLASDAKETAAYNNGESDENFLVIPYTNTMKFEAGFMDEIYRRFGIGVAGNNIFHSYSALEKMKVKLSIQFSPGTSDGSKASADWNAQKIINVSRALTNAYYEALSNQGTRRSLTANLRSGNGEVKRNLESIFQNKGKEVDEEMIRLLQGVNGPCADVLQNIVYEPYSLGHSFDTEIGFSSADEITRECILTFVRTMSQQPEVFSIAAIPVFQTFNDVANHILQGGGDENGPSPFHAKGYNGEGQVVTVSDTGVDQDNCYFFDESGPVPTTGEVDMKKRKVVQYYIDGGNENDVTGGHGTHVAGTVLGEKSLDGVNGVEDTGNGVAPKAKLSLCDIGSGGWGLNPSADMKYLLEPGRAANSHIHTGSWGAGGSFGAYTFYCKRFDEYIYLNPNFLVTMAAGNSGSEGISWPSTAKNLLSIGATYNDNVLKQSLAGFSGRGKVVGNRIKPDLLAPGLSLYSAYAGSSCQLLSMAGTSMATPAVAGSAAIIRQYIEEKGMKPSGPLVKSLLANGAQSINIGSEYDNQQGFGIVNLMKTLPLEDNNQINLLAHNLHTVELNMTNSVSLLIDTSTGCDAPLSVCLAYNDAPGESLLNDIDLEIISGNTTYFPNGLEEPDRHNLIERIRIDDGINGQEFTVNVIGKNLIQASAQYSLSISGCFLPLEKPPKSDDVLFIQSKSSEFPKPVPPKPENKTESFELIEIMGTVEQISLGYSIPISMSTQIDETLEDSSEETLEKETKSKSYDEYVLTKENPISFSSVTSNAPTSAPEEVTTSKKSSGKH